MCVCVCVWWWGGVGSSQHRSMDKLLLVNSAVCYIVQMTSLVPRPSIPPAFDRFQYAKTEGGGLGESSHVIRGTADVTDSSAMAYLHSHPQLQRRQARKLKQVS